MTILIGEYLFKGCKYQLDMSEDGLEVYQFPPDSSRPLYNIEAREVLDAMLFDIFQLSGVKTMGKDNVIDIGGKPIDPDKQPNGALLDMASSFLANVQAGRVGSAILITFSDNSNEMVDAHYDWAGPQVTLIGMLERCKHKINSNLDAMIENNTEEGEPE